MTQKLQNRLVRKLIEFMLPTLKEELKLIARKTVEEEIAYATRVVASLEREFKAKISSVATQNITLLKKEYQAIQDEFIEKMSDVLKNKNVAEIQTLVKKMDGYNLGTEALSKILGEKK